jgi:anti-anti-sigma regulatory factor
MSGEAGRSAEVTIEELDTKRARVTVRGRLDIYYGPPFLPETLRLAREGRSIALDLSEMTELGNTELDAFVHVALALAQSGGNMQIVGAPKYVRTWYRKRSIGRSALVLLDGADKA